MIRGKPLSILLICLILAACSTKAPEITSTPADSDGAPARRLDPNAIRDAQPRPERLSKRGNPPYYSVNGRTYRVMQSSSDYVERGIASWYGTKFHGRSTSSGEPYDMYAMTAAHKSLPLPTYVLVTNLNNGRQAVVKVNDRGPFHDNRLIDLSYAAATKLGILGKGTGLVEVRALDPRQPLPNETAQPLRVARVVQPVTANELPFTPDLFVQVGAFRNQLNAQRLLQRLQPQMDNRIRIQQAESDGNRIFRVQIGPLADVETTDAVTLRLAQLGIHATQIVIE
jgi:rare lipoprotein A